MSKNIEDRVSALEKELMELRRKLQNSSSQKPWWEKVAGTFEADQSYREAMQFGNDYRRTVGSSPKETD